MTEQISASKKAELEVTEYLLKKDLVEKCDVEEVARDLVKIVADIALASAANSTASLVMEVMGLA